MKPKFLAIAPAGAEFMYKRATMIAAPAKSADKIKTALNNRGYMLKPGETWHIYNNDPYTNDYITRAARVYKNKITITSY